jgi:hypothetical protein
MEVKRSTVVLVRRESWMSSSPRRTAASSSQDFVLRRRCPESLSKGLGSEEFCVCYLSSLSRNNSEHARLLQVLLPS